MKTWLIIDSNYLCYRAFYSMGDLSHEGVKTSVVFGFLREVVQLMERFETDYVVFCFDHGKSLRCVSHPDYKSKRKPKDPEKREVIREVRKQINTLRKTYLPEIGFKNVFSQRGYEADDIIGSLTENLAKHREAIIVSSDEDFYQLLGPRVLIYNPGKKRPMTVKSFREEFGINPDRWVDVKAMAGCSTDDIDGIEGIGEKTAAKFLRGDLDSKSKAHEKIVKGNSIWRRNVDLVRLPWPGVRPFKLKRDRISKEGWSAVMSSLGINSLELPPSLRR